MILGGLLLSLGSSVVPPHDLGGFLLSLGSSEVLPHDLTVFLSVIVKSATE